MFRIENLSVSYGGIQAVRQGCMTVHEAAITCLIGRNGSGKSSLANAIAGLVPSSGLVELDNKDISRQTAAARARLGISMVPEGRRVFGSLSVKENLLLAAPSDKATTSERLENVIEIFPAIRDLLGRGGHNISGGQQQMVAIARALMRAPRLLILDEPSLGLAPLVVDEVFRVIAEIAERGQSVLLIEQNAQIALEISRYAYAMALGQLEPLGETAQLPPDFQPEDLYL